MAKGAQAGREAGGGLLAYTCKNDRGWQGRGCFRERPADTLAQIARGWQGRACGRGRPVGVLMLRRQGEPGRGCCTTELPVGAHVKTNGRGQLGLF